MFLPLVMMVEQKGQPDTYCLVTFQLSRFLMRPKIHITMPHHLKIFHGHIWPLILLKFYMQSQLSITASNLIQVRT